jgi:hypothetical protein
LSATYSPRDIDVVLRDGSSVRIRAAKPTDDAAVRAARLRAERANDTTAPGMG